MNEQHIILIFLTIAVISTFSLYFWKAIKQIKNKNDERWNLILLKSKKGIDILHWAFLAIISIGMLTPSIQEISFPTKRILLILYILLGFRDLIELIGLIYYEHTI